MFWQLWFRFRLRSREWEQKLDAELRFHIEQRIEELGRSGISRDEARRQALIEFGGVDQIKEECRDSRPLAFLESILQDLRFALRQMRKTPGFTTVAVLTLALGIGANTAIFSVVDAVLLRALPYPQSDRLVVLWSTMNSQGIPRSGSALPDYREYRSRNRAFEDLGGVYYGSFNLSGETTNPEYVQGAYVTPNLFSVLGVAPLVGRAFLADEDRFGSHRVLLLSYQLWQRRYGGDPHIVGRAIHINGEQRTIVGIMPNVAPFGANAAAVELWTPISFASGDDMDSRGNHFLTLMGRVKDGVSMQQAQADVNAIASSLSQDHPENKGIGARIVPLRDQLVGNLSLLLWVLLAAVSFVLVVACVNVANLLLARAGVREREFAIRASLGAGRRRVIQQLLLESLPLAILGGTTGLMLAFWGVRTLNVMLPSAVPRYNSISVDGRVLAFTLSLSLLTVVLFALLPTLLVAKSDVQDVLVEAGRGTTTGRRRRTLRSVLVTAEVALALVLMIGAGLMVQTFFRLRTVDLGFSPANVLTMATPLPDAKYPPPEDLSSPAPAALGFYEQLLERIVAIPGVQSAGATTILFGSGAAWGKLFSVEGSSPPTSLDRVPIIRFALVSPDYFRTMGMQVRGRAFTHLDTTDSQPVAIVNETLVRRFFPNDDPIGKVVWTGPPENLLPAEFRKQIPRYGFPPRRRIIGVIADTKNPGLTEPTTPEVYAPYYQYRSEGWFNGLVLAVRSSVPPERLVRAIRQQVQALDPEQPVAEVATLEERLGGSLSQPRFNAFLLGLFAGVAMLLASIGIYGVSSYSVIQRTKEIGIRMALGAQPGGIVRMVVWQGLKLALIGVAIGLAAALALTRLIRNMLFGVSPTDTFTYVAVSIVLMGVAALASYIPARRAARVDPMQALRAE